MNLFFSFVLGQTYLSMLCTLQACPFLSFTCVCDEDQYKTCILHSPDCTSHGTLASGELTVCMLCCSGECSYCLPAACSS